MPRSNLDYFGQKNNFKNKFKNPPGACFGQSNRFAIPLGKEKPRGSTPGKYEKAANWNLDDKFLGRNSGRAIIGKEAVDVLKQTYGLREKMNVPAPGHYKSEFSEFSGANII